MAFSKQSFVISLGAAALALGGCSEAGGESGSGEASAAEAAEGEIHVTADAHMTGVTAIQEAMSGTLDEGQIEMLIAVAHQKVVAGKCDGFTIDQTRLVEEMNRIHHDAEGNELDITADELHELEKKALLGFGMAVGSQLAIASMDHDGFCEAAVAEREVEGDFPHLIYADGSSQS